MKKEFRFIYSRFFKNLSVHKCWSEDITGTLPPIHFLTTLGYKLEKNKNITNNRPSFRRERKINEQI